MELKAEEYIPDLPPLILQWTTHANTPPQVGAYVSRMPNLPSEL